MRQPRTHPDPLKNQRETWHKGAPVVVREDGTHWNRRERKSVWIAEGFDPADWHEQSFLVLLPGEPAADFKFLTQEQNEDASGVPLFNGGPGPTPTPVTVDLGFGKYRFRRRLWMMQETIPADIEDEINLNAEVTIVPTARFNSFIQRADLGSEA